MQFRDVIATAYTLAHQQYVRYGFAASHIREGGLELRAEGVLVEFDDVGCGGDFVEVEEDVFCFLGEGAEGFGEDDYCCRLLVILCTTRCG